MLLRLGVVCPTWLRTSLMLLVLCITVQTRPVFAAQTAEKQYDWDESSVPKLGSGVPLSAKNLLETEFFSGVRDYQIGDEWGKRPVDVTHLPQQSPAYVRSVGATAFFNSATSFYLGRFGNAHVMATNHHVLESESGCTGHMVNFVLRKKKYYCTSMIGSWPEIDLALFTIDVPAAESDSLKILAGNFDFYSSLSEDTPLITAGFGIAGNGNRQMMVNENADCRVMSGTDEFHLMADPDKYNPADYSAWSFATGCSVSHGDSGSAMVNRKTGAVVGLLWTGAIPKEERIQHSNYLRSLQSSKGEEIWTLLTYAVPAQKIAVKLKALLASGELKPEHQLIVKELLTK
ncbi:serine protease [bacterium]|nr:serine protease [bacterium]